jgi:hypothetical protein
MKIRRDDWQRVRSFTSFTADHYTLTVLDDDRETILGTHRIHVYRWRDGDVNINVTSEFCERDEHKFSWKAEQA